jgi:hypothetical protein
VPPRSGAGNRLAVGVEVRRRTRHPKTHPHSLVSERLAKHALQLLRPGLADAHLAVQTVDGGEGRAAERVEPSIDRAPYDAQGGQQEQRRRRCADRGAGL